MRRWMVIGAIVAVVLIIGSGVGYVTYKGNRPDRMWVPLLLNPELPEENREVVAKELREKLFERERLAELSRELGLVKLWQLESEEEGVRELEQRAFVDVGEAATPMGVSPALLIGVTGKQKERSMLGKIALRLAKEVQTFIELPPPEPSPEREPEYNF